MLALHAEGLCPICFKPLDSNIYLHDACDIFCAVKDSKDTRTSISKKKLDTFKGDWIEVTELALFSLFIPWDIKDDTLPEWFSRVESILAHLENQKDIGRIARRIVTHLGRYLYPLPRIFNENKFRDIERTFSSWDPQRPQHPLDHFLYIKQPQHLNPHIETTIGNPWLVLRELERLIPNYDYRLGAYVQWKKCTRIGREVCYQENRNRVYTTRMFHDKALISSFFDLRGTWAGWPMNNEGPFEPSEKEKALPDGLRFPSRIHVLWKDLCECREEDNLRQILSAMGKDLRGTCDKRRTDDRADRSYAEILDKGLEGIFESIYPNTEFNRGIRLDFSEPIEDVNLNEHGSKLIKKYSRFNGPTCPEQAEAIGFLSRNENALVQVIMPTGSGKSLIPLTISGMLYSERRRENPLVLVVCPLVALLEDQVKSAKRDTMVEEFKSCADRIACLHSRKDEKKFESVLRWVEDGSCSLLYLTADQLQFERVLRSISTRKVAWIFIDEGHGIVEFESYRPAYYRIWYPIMRLKACCPSMGVEVQTATLPNGWKEHLWARIIQSRDVPRVKEIISPRIRDNLIFKEIKKLEGHEVRNDAAIKRALEQALAGNRTILYTLYKEKENFFKRMYDEMLKASKGEIILGCYSSGHVMIGKDRVDPDDFVRNFSEGRIDLILATMAFGMGIDRGDVKTIVFNGLPISLNTLYQQAGRAGRAIDNEGRYKYNGEIFIYYSLNDDVGHQHHLSSFSELYGNTVTRLLTNMLLSKRTAVISRGLILLDLWADYPYSDREGKIDPRKVNIYVLRILEKIGLVDWLATLPTSIEKDSRAWTHNEPSDALGEQKGKRGLSTSTYLRDKLSSLEAIESIYDLIDSISDPDARWGKSGGFALVAWKQRMTRDDIQRKVAEWKADRSLEFDSEFKYVLDFISADASGMDAIIKGYYGI